MAAKIKTVRPDGGWATGLTDVEVRLVREYLIDGNQYAAFVRAGYAASSAANNAFRKFKEPKIIAAIEAASEQRAAQTGIDAEWLLSRLAAEADADVADLYDEDGFLKHVSDWPRIWRTGLVAGMDVLEEKTDRGLSSRLVKIKLADRTKRLDMIGRHVNIQAFRDRIDHGLTREAAKLIGDQMTAKEAADAYRAEVERGD